MSFIENGIKWHKIETVDQKLMLFLAVDQMHFLAEDQKFNNLYGFLAVDQNFYELFSLDEKFLKPKIPLLELSIYCQNQYIQLWQ